MYIPNLQQGVPENSVKTKIKTETNNAWQPQHGAMKIGGFGVMQWRRVEKCMDADR